MRKLLILLFLGGLLLHGHLASAKESRFFALGGFGQAKATSAGVTSSSRMQSPGGFGFSVDQNISGSYFGYVEHMRSFGTGGTSIGLTGIGLKFYPWLNPLYVRNVHAISGRSLVAYQGYLPYVGLSCGFGQASMLGSSTADDILAVGGYVAAKAGIEVPYSEGWGFVGEWNYANSVAGSGTIQALNVIFGGYLAF